jgi:hypothetical protein
LFLHRPPERYQGQAGVRVHLHMSVAYGFTCGSGVGRAFLFACREAIIR